MPLIPEAGLGGLTDALSVDAEMAADMVCDFWARVGGAQLQKRGAAVTPLLHYPLRASQSDNSRRANVLSVMFSFLPSADDSTPWEAIFDFRRDTEAKNYFNRLMAWSAKAAIGVTDPADLAYEFAAMLTDYETHMRIQHRKINRSRTEVVLVGIAESIEDLVHLKLSRSLSRLFELSRTEATLLEAELKAPGREVAYISFARARLSPSSRL